MASGTCRPKAGILSHSPESTVFFGLCADTMYNNIHCIFDEYVYRHIHAYMLQALSADALIEDSTTRVDADEAFSSPGLLYPLTGSVYPLLPGTSYQLCVLVQHHPPAFLLFPSPPLPRRGHPPIGRCPRTAHTTLAAAMARMFSLVISQPGWIVYGHPPCCSDSWIEPRVAVGPTLTAEPRLA